MKNIYESQYLTSEEQIKDYFMDNGYDHFECGEGEYQDEVELTVKIGDEYFEVFMTAEIGSQRQDRGDRLYWVEEVETVTYKKVSTFAAQNKARQELLAIITAAQVELQTAKEALKTFDIEVAKENGITDGD
jgi:hypothetical protein